MVVVAVHVDAPSTVNDAAGPPDGLTPTTTQTDAEGHDAQWLPEPPPNGAGTTVVV